MKKILYLALISLLFASTACGQKKNQTNTAKVETKTTAETKKADSKLFGANLIRNSDAESGNGDGWTNADELKTIVYGDFGGGPTRDSPGPQTRGDKYFYARTSTETPTVVFTQKIDVAEVSEIVDKGNVNYNFGGWFGIANGSSSAGRLRLAFFDKDGKQISTDSTEEIKEAERPADEVLVEKSKSGNLPNGTRKIEVSLEFKIFPGHDEKQDNLAFADNLSLVLTNNGDK